MIHAIPQIVNAWVQDFCGQIEGPGRAGLALGAGRLAHAANYLDPEGRPLPGGAGCNGKSVFMAALVAFLGKRNCTAISLHKLEGNPFATSRLVGKLANICPDLPAARLRRRGT